MSHKKVTFLSLIIALMLGVCSAGVSVFASTGEGEMGASKNIVIRNIPTANQLINEPSLDVDQPQTLKALLDSTPWLTAVEKNQIIQQAILSTKMMPSTRTRYYKSYVKYSHAQCVKISKAGDAITMIMVATPKPYSYVAAFVYGHYYNRFKIAAQNGWGLKITLTIDSYNPTSMGMKYSYSYIK